MFLSTEAAVLTLEALVSMVHRGEIVLETKTGTSAVSVVFLLTGWLSFGKASIADTGLEPRGGNSTGFGTHGAGPPPRAGNSSVSSLKSFFLTTRAFGAFLAALDERGCGVVSSSIS